MRIVTKKVYYCEYCKKKGLSSYHVSKHEKACTANPGRHCNLCGRDTQKVIDSFNLQGPDATIRRIEGKDAHALKEYFKDIEEEIPHTGNLTEEATEKIYKAIDCPVCTLAFLRQNEVFACDNWDWKRETVKILEERHKEEEDVR